VTDPVLLLGRHVDDAAVQSFLLGAGGSHVREPIDEDLPDRQYVSSDDSGVELSIDPQGYVRVVYLHLDGHESKPGYSGSLPCGLHAGITQREARALLGVPQFAQPARELALLGRYGPVDRYDYPEFSVHLQYSEAAVRLELVTLMVPSAVPGRDTSH
jgi:hypothetical protein